MKKHILVYGFGGGMLIAALKLVEYRFLVVEHSVEIYGGLIALLFAVLGIWLGLKLTKNKETIVVKEVPVLRKGYAFPSSALFTLNACGSASSIGGGAAEASWSARILRADRGHPCPRIQRLKARQGCRRTAGRMPALPVLTA